MSSNLGVAHVEPDKVEVKSIECSKLKMPASETNPLSAKDAPHGVFCQSEKSDLSNPSKHRKEKPMTTNRYSGAENLLTPDNHALLLIDHQYLQLMALTSHKPALVANNATAVAKTAKVFNVPTLLTTAFAERQALLKEIQAVFPDQKAIDRTGLNSWDDKRVVDWVQKIGRKKLVMAGLWTEVCLNLAVLSALGDGYDVYIIPDASGGGDAESHAMGVQRMVQAGAVPLSTLAYVSELQRDWAREATVPAVLQIFEQHGGSFGSALRWEWDLLGLKEGTR